MKPKTNLKIKITISLNKNQIKKLKKNKSL
jgi:hypothetical protein